VTAGWRTGEPVFSAFLRGSGVRTWHRSIARRLRVGASGWVSSQLRRCCRRAFRWRTEPAVVAIAHRPIHVAQPTGDREAGRAGQARGRRIAPELSARGQARRHYGGALYGSLPVQACPARRQIPANPAAVGYNFGLLLRWFRRLLRALLLIFARARLAPSFS
jgi:hypothetical protein